MALIVKWTKRAEVKLTGIIDYLMMEWGETSVGIFVNKLDFFFTCCLNFRRLEVLKILKNK